MNKLNKKQIWIINYYAAPPNHATMFRHFCFARELEHFGYEVRIFTASTIHNTDIEIDTFGKEYLEQEYDGIKFVHLKTKKYSGSGIRRMFELYSFPIKIGAISDRFPHPDVIVHSAFVPFDYKMSRLARKLNSRYIVEIHDLWPASFVAYGLIGQKHPLLRFLYREEQRLYNIADAIIFSIEGGKDYIRDKGWDTSKKLPVKLEKIHNINQGIDLAAYDIDSLKDYADHDLDDPTKFKVVYVGSIRLANNLSSIIDAADELRRKGRTDIIFLIFGDGDRRKHLELECAERGLTNILFKGRVKPSDVPAILKKAGLTLFNFGETELLRFGLSPNKLFLYFASGKPVLSTIRPAYDLVERYHAGKSVANDSESISNGVIEFADAKEADYAAYCRGARQAAIDYDYRNLAKKLLSIINL